jgi:AraC-like DNA-binding protein
MFNGDFSETIKELHYNRGVPITEIATELGVSRRLLYYLMNFQKRISPRVFKRAEIVFQDLFSKYHPLVNSNKFTKYGPLIPLKSNPSDAYEENRIRRERIMGIFGEMDCREKNRLRRERIIEASRKMGPGKDGVPT